VTLGGEEIEEGLANLGAFHGKCGSLRNALILREDP